MIGLSMLRKNCRVFVGGLQNQISNVQIFALVLTKNTGFVVKEALQHKQQEDIGLVKEQVVIGQRVCSILLANVQTQNKNNFYIHSRFTKTAHPFGRAVYC